MSDDSFCARDYSIACLILLSIGLKVLSDVSEITCIE